jgi:hypothetical protein
VPNKRLWWWMLPLWRGATRVRPLAGQMYACALYTAARRLGDEVAGDTAIEIGRVSQGNSVSPSGRETIGRRQGTHWPSKIALCALIKRN